MALPARFQHMTQQEQAGEPKTVLKVLVRPAVRTGLAFPQEARQSEQPVAPGFARDTRYRAAEFRRDIDQVRRLSGRGAVFQVKPEAELGQHRKLEADQLNRGFAGI